MAKSKTFENWAIGLTLVVLIGAIAIGVFVLTRQSTTESRKLSILYEMQDACDEYSKRSADVSASVEGCAGKIDRIMTAYPAIVEKCYDDYADIETMMLYCLEENDITFAG